MPYGLPHVTARECRQLHAGNVFLCLCFQMFLSLSLQGKFWALEHPKEGASYTPSIWRLFVVRILECFPGNCRVFIWQGLCGGRSPKPTRFLLGSMTEPEAHLASTSVPPCHLLYEWTKMP